jgi:CubicO group peptidase (beta-lactamase class C family)
MRLPSLIVALMLGFAGLAKAAPSPADQAAIIAFESRQTPASAKDQPDTRALAERMAEMTIPGVSDAFIEDGKETWARAHGVASVGGSQAAQ